MTSVVGYSGCTAGVYENALQWKTLFPNHAVPLKGKALVSIPIGARALESISKLVKSMGHKAFDFKFFAYDDTNWTAEEWFGMDGVSVIRTAGGRKWTLYFDYLLAENVTSYTHLFLWDDDLEPTIEFDGEVLLHLLQAFDVGISQPMISLRAHTQFEGTASSQREWGLLHQVAVVEIMAPIYSSLVWSDCIRPRMARDRGSGWGLDLWLQNYGDCVPDQIYSVGLALDHMDKHSLSKSFANGNSKSEGNRYAAEARRGGWKPRAGLGGPFNDLGVRLDAECTLSLVEHS
jgi:hypothetical protein